MLTAALEAGARGKSIQTILARTARFDDMRIKVDPNANNAALWRMVRNSRLRNIRITAGEAGKNAIDKGGRRVRREFAALADDCGLSAATREDIRRYLARHR